MRILLDSGSQLLLVRRRTAQKVSLSGELLTLQIALAAGEKSNTTSEQKVFIKLRSLSGDYETPILSAITTKTCIAPLPKVTLDPKKYECFRGLTLTEEYPQTTNSDIDILVDCSTTIALLDNRCPPRNSGNQGGLGGGPKMAKIDKFGKNQFFGPRPLCTKLGWCMAGQDNQKTENELKISASIVNKQVCQDADHPMFARFFGFQDLGLLPVRETEYTADEEKSLVLMKEGTKYCHLERRFETSLLFKLDPTVHLDSHFKISYVIAKNSRKKAIRDNRIKDVDAALEHLIQMGACEKVPLAEQRKLNCHYLPCRAVYQDQSRTQKVRLCHNASSKCTSTKKSLNSCLLPGIIGQYMPDLVALVLQFRLHKHILLTDISRLFFEIRISPADRDWQRFLYAHENNEEPIAYRMCSLIMGAVSSPFQALYCIKMLCDLFENEFPEAVETIKDKIYVDDLVGVFDCATKATKVARQLVQLFSKCSMRCHKFKASSDQILNNAEIKMDQRQLEDTVKVLGLQWHVPSDTIEFKYYEGFEDNKVETKRTALRACSQVWDPAALIQPVIFKCKILIKRCWEEGLDWDTPLSGPLLKDFLKWKESIKQLDSIKLPRMVLSNLEPGQAWLAVSSDASFLGIGVCVHVVSGHSSQLLYSRSRISPMKDKNKEEPGMSIIRLELVSILLATRTVAYIENIVGKTFFTSVVYFTDSLVNCQRIKNGDPNSYKQWTAARLLEISHRMTRDQINHLPGALNASDYCSRGCFPLEIKDNSLWLHGPNFYLLPRSSWPQEKALTKKEAEEIQRLDKLEQKGNTPVIQATSAAARYIFKSHLSLDQLTEKTSNCGRLIRSISYIFRFLVTKCPKLKEKTKLFQETNVTQTGHLTVPETRVATMYLIRTDQRKHFQKDLELIDGELKPKYNSPLVQMRCFEDKHGLFRGVTRLDQAKTIPESSRRPILLPKNSEFVQKYLLYLHSINGHTTLSNFHYYLQRSFFIIGGKKQLQKIVKQCRQTNCQNLRTLHQVCPPLPSPRVDISETSQNWTTVSLDYFGPILFRNPDQGCSCPNPIQKSYGLILTDFYSRAIDLQLCRSQKVEDFFTAFTRYTSYRGVPTTLFSDHSKTFSAADRQLNKILKAVDWSKVKDQMVQKSITWTWSIPKWSQSNGLTERMILMVKKSLNSTLMASSNLTFSQIELLLSQCQLDVNDRPLHCRSEAFDDPESMVTPSLLNNGRFLRQLPIDARSKLEDVPVTRMLVHRRLLANKFFKNFRKSYLYGLQALKFAKQGQDPPITPGMIVMYHEDSLKPKYKIALLHELKRSPTDQQIRRVVLKTPNKTLIERSINQISLCEADVPESYKAKPKDF